jgi:hypothetical protein
VASGAREATTKAQLAVPTIEGNLAGGPGAEAGGLDAAGIGHKVNPGHRTELA